VRVLYCTLPHHTHFLTAAPLLWALRTAGHEVRVACLPGFAGTVTDAGLTAVPLGIDPETTDTPEDRAAIRRGLPPPYDIAERPADQVAWTPEMAESYDIMVQYAFREENEPLVGDLVAFTRSWQPDLLVWEPFSFAGAIAATAAGVPHARLLFTVDVLGIAHDWIRRHVADDPLRDWLTEAVAAHGGEFSPDLVFGQFTIDQLPAALRVGDRLEYLSMRYIPYGGPAKVPGWLAQPPARPRVALTLGLSAIEYFDGYTVRPLELVEALADLDVEVVATVGDGDRQPGALPANCRVVPYVPLHALAPTCAAVVHHGGFGTLSTVALSGVPQLVLPYHFEGPLLASRLAAQGAGITLHSDLAKPDAVREAVQRLLGQPVFRSRAADLRDEMVALPAPNDLVPLLEERAAAGHLRNAARQLEGAAG
jgi:glycosyltransferase (activator-dependent family)